jgi:hypothetical protein
MPIGCRRHAAFKDTTQRFRREDSKAQEHQTTDGYDSEDIAKYFLTFAFMVMMMVMMVFFHNYPLILNAKGIL